ncbi:hypothetical protein LYSHEL_16380 [Lysobacter helvus]|uniref:Uncharacterized protein n=2 Tax=Lysobacteraceae TaxID=32033 RepID=A0ABN6FSE1_9GAMM|nr:MULTISPECIES: hypothetical protein [Lysobacter]BCT92614.1 hypothetical protein LYSCAS_16380 [Lysobacter caseinilyticus]BCT95767.1 hypothetical protein LYSHEL_16380 [Lysobacter helvus]
MHRRNACGALASVFLLPGIACLGAVFVPSLHGTGFWNFAVQHWWQLFLVGGVLFYAARIACAFFFRR